MGTKIQLRRGNKADLPTLDNGELGFVQDTTELYVGTPTGNEKLTFDQTKYDSYDAQLAEIAHQNVAYVETTGNDTNGRLNQIGKPFATINAALDALPSTGGVIKIGLGRFAPVDKAKFKDNVSFIGSKRPHVNSDYTGLQDGTGTIINGAFQPINRHYIEIRNLGVDSGSNICTTLYGNANTIEGITISPFNIGGPFSNLPLLKGIIIENVVAITKNSTVPVHTLLCEGVIGAYVNNVETYWGLHGAVFKVVESNVNNVWGYGSGNNGVIVKASEGYFAPCHDSHFSNLFARPLNGLGAGIYIHSDSGSNLTRNNFTNLNAINTEYGIKLYGETGCLVASNNFNNIVADNCASDALNLIGNVVRNNFSNLELLAPLAHGIEFSSESYSNVFTNVKIFPDGTELGAAKTIFFRGKNNIVSDAIVNTFNGGTVEIDGSIGINYLKGLRIENGSVPTFIGDTDKLYSDIQSSCSAYNTVSQSVSSGVATMLNLNAERWDTHSIHDLVTNPTRFTVKVTGKYHVVGGMEFESNATGYRYLFFNVNGGYIANLPPITVLPSSATGTALNISYDLQLQAGDYIELGVLQNSGIALNVSSANLSIHRIND